MMLTEIKEISGDEPIHISFNVGLNEIIFCSDPDKFKTEETLSIVLRLKGKYYTLPAFISASSASLLFSDKWELGLGYPEDELSVEPGPQMALAFIFDMAGLDIDFPTPEGVKDNLKEEQKKSADDFADFLQKISEYFGSI